uniref:FAD-binding domain-containing protein n=1 Tax=Rhodosorus marinus TaxID=101924 RepID=A0A7S2ZQD7_9RHOD|mmetsp:Transcript_28062/g.110349  ORF Transcript_28062/g.110349 Transcript_28062/m.110349 type:complete len:154 (+) Transcript_28062:510-971(+)
MKRFLSTSSGLSTKSFDVVIAGGGLVGASVALGLATDKLAAPLSVAIVDTSLPPAKEEVYDKPTLRTSTISLKSRKWMQGLGAWKDRHATAFGDMFVYDKNQGITFDAKQDGMDNPRPLLLLTSFSPHLVPQCFPSLFRQNWSTSDTWLRMRY